MWRPGGEKQKKSGEKPTKSWETIVLFFPPLGLHSSPPLRRAAHNNEHRLGIYTEIALGQLGLKIIVIFKNRFRRCLEPSTIQFTLSHKPWIMLWKKMDGLVLPAWFSIPETCSSMDKPALLSMSLIHSRLVCSIWGRLSVWCAGLSLWCFGVFATNVRFRHRLHVLFHSIIRL